MDLSQIFNFILSSGETPGRLNACLGMSLTEFGALRRQVSKKQGKEIAG